MLDEVGAPALFGEGFVLLFDLAFVRGTLGVAGVVLFRLGILLRFFCVAGHVPPFFTAVKKGPGETPAPTR